MEGNDQLIERRDEEDDHGCNINEMSLLMNSDLDYVNRFWGVRRCSSSTLDSLGPVIPRCQYSVELEEHSRPGSIRGADDVPSPSLLIKGDQYLDAGYVGLVRDTGVGASSSPADLQDLVQALLVVLLQCLEVFAVDSPHLRAKKEGGNHHSSVNRDLGIGSNVVVLGDPFPQVAKGCLGTLEAMLDLFLLMKLLWPKGYFQ
eukprot:g36936.t1